MPLTQNERDLITASPDGANKLTEIDRMTEAERELRVLFVGALNDQGQPLSPSKIATRRAKTINQIVRYRTKDHVRAWINILSLGPTGLNLSADNDYSNPEQKIIEAYAEKLDGFSLNFDHVKHSVKALKDFNRLDSRLNDLLQAAGNTNGNRRQFLLNILKA